MTVTLACHLWALAGQERAMRAYEDTVLALVGAHRGRVVSRVGTDGADGRPHELQVIEFADRDGLDAYLADPARTSLQSRRDATVARTELFDVAVLA